MSTTPLGLQRDTVPDDHPVPIYELEGTLLHCGVAMVNDAEDSRDAGQLLIQTTRLHCDACSATATVAVRLPVPPRSQAEAVALQVAARARALGA